MKTLLCITFSLLIGTFAHAQSEWRTFTSPDGQRTFEGQLIAYNENTSTITVRNRQGQTIHFKQDLVTAQDREYVRAAAKDLSPNASTNASTNVSLDVRFERLQERDSTTRSGRTRTSTYDAGYKIVLNNYTPQHVGNVEVEYLLIYRKDQVDGQGANQIIRGSTSTAVEANRTKEVETQTVQLVNFFERGQASSGGCSSCPNAQSSVSRSKRSRDYLVGCVARVKVDGQVVRVAATSPNVQRQYEAEFDNKGGNYTP